MSGSPRGDAPTSKRARLASVVVVVVVLSGVAAFPIGTTSAQQASTFAVAQGAQCFDVSPVTNEEQSVSEFYDYRNPHPNITGNPASFSYSSFGTVDYQRNQISTLMLYSGSAGASLVVVNDKLQNAPSGSTVTMEFDGLPPEGEWVIRDDAYPNQIDDFEVSADGRRTKIDWTWMDHRTDGAAFRGLNSDSYDAIRITPFFNERSEKWNTSGDGGPGNRIEGWELVTGQSDRVELDMEQPAYLHRGPCVTESPPSAALSVDASAVEVGQSVTFDASETIDDDGVAQYRWDFDGDGTADASTESATVDHQYDSEGTYEVTVAAIDTYGNADTETAQVTVVENESTTNETQMDLTLSASPSASTGDEVSFEASASTGNEVSFEASASTGNESAVVEYQWDFGDGTTATTTAPETTHTYASSGTYTATVTAADGAGATATASQQVVIEESNATAPGNDTASPGGNDRRPDGSDVVRASLGHWPESPEPNQDVEYISSGSTGAGSISEYQWDFGDGETMTSTDPRVYHRYAQSGTYSVSVTVVDERGNTDTNRTELIVGSGAAQVAEVDAPTEATVGESVTFDASNSTGGEVAEYRWDFDGDGTIDATTAEPTASWAFDATGTYTASVVIVGTDGARDRAQTQLTITDVQLDPTIVASQNPTNVGDTVTFEMEERSDTAPSQLADVQWDFGDGASASGTSVSHSYAESGTYNVTLTVTANTGATAVTSTSVTVDAPANQGANGGAGGDDNAAGGGGGGDNSAAPGGGGSNNGGNSGGGDGGINDILTGNTDGGSTDTLGGGGDGGSGDGGSGDGGSGDGGSGDGGSGDGGSGGSSGPSSGTGSNTGGTNADAGVGDDSAQQSTQNAEPRYVLNTTVSPRPAVEGENVTVNVTVSNVGNEGGTKGVEFETAGRGDSRDIRLEPGENRTITFTHRYAEPGNETIEIDHSERINVTVVPAEPRLSVVDLAVADRTIRAGEPVEIVATVRNDGYGNGTMPVELELFGEVVESKNVTLAVNETSEVSFTSRVESEGNYTAVVGDERVPFAVEGTADGTSSGSGDAWDGNSESGASVPGFGAVVAVAALLLTALSLVRSRRRR